jgi:hypothetical protein
MMLVVVRRIVAMRDMVVQIQEAAKLVLKDVASVLRKMFVLPVKSATSRMEINVRAAM